jgi:hypothetical protein
LGAGVEWPGSGLPVLAIAESLGSASGSSPLDSGSTPWFVSLEAVFLFTFGMIGQDRG